MVGSHFPGDPRFGTWLSPCKEDISPLSQEAFLKTSLLDCILQRAVPPPEATSSKSFHIGSLGARCFIESSNDLIRDHLADGDLVEDAKMRRRKIGRTRNQMKSTFGSHPFSRLLIPIVELSHFFVLCLDCSFGTPLFVTNVTLYDSLRRRTRQINPNVAGILKEWNFFICHFILHARKHEDLRQTDEALLQNVQYRDCPRQLNGYDCGLFAVGIILHLVEGKDIGTETFTQEHITNLRSELVTVFASDDGAASETTSRVVRSCFPQLNGSSILDSFGVEVVSKKKDVPVAKVLSVTKHRLRSDSVDEVIISSPMPDSKKVPVAKSVVSYETSAQVQRCQ